MYNGFETGKLMYYIKLTFMQAHFSVIRLCSDKSQQLMPLETYTIITDRKKLRSSDSDHDVLVPSLSSSTAATATTSIPFKSNAEILNRRFKDLPPEELQFSDESDR